MCVCMSACVLLQCERVEKILMVFVAGLSVSRSVGRSSSLLLYNNIPFFLLFLYFKCALFEPKSNQPAKGIRENRRGGGFITVANRPVTRGREGSSSETPTSKSLTFL